MPTKLSTLLPKQFTSERLVMVLWDPDDEAQIECYFGCQRAALAAAGRTSTASRWGPKELRAHHLDTRLRSAPFARRKGNGPREVDVDCTLIYIVHSKADGKEAPNMGLIQMQQREDWLPPEFGWALLPQYHRQGYGVEMTRAFVEQVVTNEDVCGLRDGFAWTWTDTSRKIAERAGLTEKKMAQDEKGEKFEVSLLPGTLFQEGSVLPEPKDQNEQIQAPIPL